MKTDLFQPCGHCWALQISWHIECSTFTASSFGIWNSSTGIPSPPLALFVVMFLSAHLAFHSRMSGSRWVITPLWLSGSWRSLANHFTALRTPWINHLYYLSKWTIPLYQESESESEVAQSCPTLCDPMNRSTPGLPVHDHLPEFTQTHVHRVRVAIQSSHPLSSHSLVFLYFFALITEEGFLMSPCYSLELCFQMGISFLFSFAFHFLS